VTSRAQAPESDPGAGPPEGGLLVDKEPGPTSHDLVVRARRALGLRRVGHTGTLDPFASGLLILLVGASTRLAEYLHDLPKEYRARVRLGRRTTTDDPEGEVTGETEAWRELEPSAVAAAFEGLTGTLEQVPPAFSAKKLQGEAAHRKARRGDAVALAPVRIRVHEMEVEEVDLPYVKFRVLCSTGTYVRALARDVGDALAVGGHLTELRRTRIGTFSVEEAVSGERLDDVEARRPAWRTPLELLSHVPRIEVCADEARRLASGQALEMPSAHVAGGVADPGLPTAGAVAVAEAGRLVAVAERDGPVLRPRKVFPRD